MATRCLLPIKSMRKFAILSCCVAALLFLIPTSSRAQNKQNNAADNIVGLYEAWQNHDHFKAKITKLADGSYKGQVVWAEKDRDKHGNKRLDHKNPDKSLRSLPLDQAVLFSGLKYDAAKREWNGTKVYDPQRGVRANMDAHFLDDGRLCIRGTFMKFSEKVYWKRISSN